MDAFFNGTWAGFQRTPDVSMTFWSTIVVLLATLVTTSVLRSQSSRSTRSLGDALEITQLHIYPVKSLRGCTLQAAHLGRYGFVGDLEFDEQKSTGGEVLVKWEGRGTEVGSTATNVKTEDEIRFPLMPSVETLRNLNIDLHGSKTRAYDMGDAFAIWFSERLGFETRLVYIGDGSRQILGSLAPNSKGGLRKAGLMQRLRSLFPFLGFPEERLVFSDLAHYLVVTEESNAEASARIGGDLGMDVRKFRPNVVIKGASGAFVEDFWGELTFNGGVRMPLTANCFRCQSITVDFETGKKAADDRGLVWKKLNKDRRVDKGMKYSPVFGRYGYCYGPALGKTLRVGQTAQVTRINSERTAVGEYHFRLSPLLLGRY
ncbi:Mitochondrial amidoxime-reducing component 1 [Colletotrichum chlorophyti]|uniref:Mitochondrial amidoxime-reducing component 1 n=1 Tax=Colletotrichum chlorophyti TaxID=708187 RepID=A0A1Q8RXN1_9PEZI|nr:Mitochondrial amidoxime-reducing component 1 [Colletotrichum chlorophyti]